MNNSIRKTIAGGLLAVTMLGGGAAVATAATTTGSSGTSATTASAQARPHRPEARNDRRTADLAKQLGVSTATLTKAQDAARAVVDAKYGVPQKPPAPTDGTRPTTPPPEPTAAQKAEMKARHDLFEQTLAAKLGITTTELRSAVVAVEKAHLAQEVADGHLTQAQADAMLTAIENGTAPVGPRGPGGPGGPGHRPDGPPPASSSTSSSSGSSTTN